MSIPPVRLITFDATGTLLQFRTSPLEQYAAVGRLYGINADANQLKSRFKVTFKQMSRSHPIFGRKTGIGWEKWWQEVVLGTFHDYISTENDKETVVKVASHLINKFQTNESWNVAPGAEEVLKTLKENGVKMGVISNFDSRLQRILQNIKIHQYFQFVLTSFEFGFEKPDKRIFEEALRLSGEKHDAALHLGDDYKNDYQGAVDAGWRSILLSGPNDTSKHDVGGVCFSLFDFKEFLQKEGIIK